jgi:UDP-hydrolysing UDP-N-acetyl-D-glucosamine 2-epimerase
MHLLFLTGSRGEWGYIRPLLRLCDQRPDVTYSIVATNMHLLPSYGMSVKEIEADGFRVDHRIYASLDGYNHVTMVKSLGVLLSSLADIVASRKPDWLVLAGDRGEQLMGSIVGAFCYIPVAHIQAGEVSGNIDGMTRHAIGKYAHLHLAANEDAAERLRKLGEEQFRIHNVGAPQLDELVQAKVSSREEVQRRLGINLERDFILVAQHPVTEEMDVAGQQIAATMAALGRFAEPKIVILPNNDAGSVMIREGIESARHGEFHCFANLKREDYLALMRDCVCLVGNSSSGLLEAPTFRVPAVNLGRRQLGRVRGANVIDAPFDPDAIANAIERAKSDEFRAQLARDCANPYGDGRSSERILNLLTRTRADSAFLIKQMTY